MATYYVAANGSDSNSGTSSSSPWATMNNTYGINWRAGDSLLFRGGDTFAGMVWVGGAAGTQAAPITIGSYGTGRATIANNNSTGIYIENTNHIVVQDLTIVGTAGTSEGINVYNTQTGRTSGLTIRRCEVRAWQKGIVIGSSTASNGTNGVLVEDVDVHSNSRDGLTVYGAVSGTTYSNLNVTIRRVRAWGNTGESSYTPSHSGNGIIVGCTDGGLVEDCEAWGNGANNGWSGGGPVGIWAERARSVVIRKCYSHGNLSNNGKDGAGFDLDIGCVSCTIEQCLSVGNAGPGVLLWGSSGSVVRHNIIIGNGTTNYYSDVHVGGNAPGEGGGGGPDLNALVYGNTIIAKASGTRTPSAVFVETGTSGAKFVNNVLRAPSTLAEVPTGTTPSVAWFVGNLWWNGTGFRALVGTRAVTSIATWRSTYSQERSGTANVGLVADPQITDTDPTALVVATTSPTQSAGLPYASLSIDPGTVDYAGTPLTDPPPIGALVVEVSAPPAWLAFF